mmetsp:Transcript_93910/g.298085  ORF Transcript_93910/g.298085 Transcript_93910/m.298085 type:complete len:139 (+) Transcript_93910:2-418(+)
MRDEHVIRTPRGVLKVVASPAGEVTPDAPALATLPKKARRRLCFKQPEPRPAQAERSAKRLKTQDLRVLPIACKKEPGELEFLCLIGRAILEFHTVVRELRDSGLVQTLSEVRDAVHELRRTAVPDSRATLALTAEAK